MVLQHLEEHQDEAIDGAGWFSCLAGRQPWQGMKGAMNQRMPIKENQERLVQVTNLQ
jgi:hypothetical protein